MNSPGRSARRAAAALAATLAIAGTGAPPAAAAPDTVEVVNLGDSYSAAFGTGAPFVPVPGLELPSGGTPSTNDPCVQSTGSDHVEALDRHPRVEVILDAACGGATTADVLARTELPAVREALADAELVALTMGGNDIGWTDFIRACSAQGSAAACDLLLESAPDRIAAAAASAARTVSALDEATDGRIVVMGYPQLFDTTHDSALITAQRAAQLNYWTNRLNAALEDAVEGEGAVFVDVADRFRGHGVGAQQPWIFLDPTEPGNANNLHPTEKGYLSGYLPSLLSQAARAA